jgi:DNA-directed RNA polymerase alpha subunit
MTDQTTTAIDETPLGKLAETNVASTEWWKPDAPERSEFELPTRVLKALEDDGIMTVAQLKAAGPHRLRNIEHIGKQGFDQIVTLLRALDRQNGGGSNGRDQQGQTFLR